MKLSTKIILPIVLISALLILLAGCAGTGTVPDESPGYTPGTITGTIAAPCCSTSTEHADGEATSPEYWCFYCQNTWSLQDGIEVVLTYGDDDVDTTTTNELGEYTFSDVPPGKNYVVTAYCPDFSDNRPLVKDVALEITEGNSFDTKVTDLVSTSLGLVVDFLVTYTEMGPEDISLIEVIADKPNFPNFPKFKKLVYEVRRVLENCDVNILTDDKLQDALCLASEEVGRETDPELVIGCSPGYTSPPPPNLCAGNTAPVITDPSEGSSIPANEGVPFTYDVEADDNPAQTLTFTLDQASKDRGMTIGENSGKITWANPICDCLDTQLDTQKVANNNVDVPICNYPVTVTVEDSCHLADTVTFNVDVTCITQYTLTVTIVGNGSVEVEGTTYTVPVTVDEGTVLGLEAFADSDWQFDGWSGDASGTGSTTSVTMNADKAVTATFSEIPTPQYTLTVTIVGNGSVEVEGTTYTVPVTVDEGTVLGLEAFADSYWYFDGWNGTNVGDLTDNGDGTYSITMDNDKVVTANFTRSSWVENDGLRVAFEDLEFIPNTKGSISCNDWDYNDWVGDINIIYHLLGPDKLTGIEFTITHVEHLAGYQHEFHLIIPGGGVGGTYDLNLSTGNTLVTGDNNIEVIPDTSTASGAYVLNIYYSEAVDFDYNSYEFDPVNIHGERLFFEPVLVIPETSESIGKTDIRMLTVPLLWKYPGSRVRIWTVYNEVESDGGKPCPNPMFTIPGTWTLTPTP